MAPPIHPGLFPRNPAAPHLNNMAAAMAMIPSYGSPQQVIPPGYRAAVYSVAQAYAGINYEFIPNARLAKIGDPLEIRIGHKAGYPNGVGFSGKGFSWETCRK